MLNIISKLENKSVAKIEDYFKQCLKRVCALAPADANVTGNIAELANSFRVNIDVHSIVWEGTSYGQEENAFLAIDFAIGEMLEKINVYKDGRRF